MLLLSVYFYRNTNSSEKGDRDLVFEQETTGKHGGLCRMEHKLTLFLLCAFVFFTAVTSQQDNGIYFN